MTEQLWNAAGIEASLDAIDAQTAAVVAEKEAVAANWAHMAAFTEGAAYEAQMAKFHQFSAMFDSWHSKAQHLTSSYREVSVTKVGEEAAMAAEWT